MMNSYFLTGEISVLFWSLILTIPTTTQVEEWRLRKDKDGIQVYTRKTEASDLDEFKGVSRFPFSMEKIVAVLQEPGAYQQWASGVIIAEFLGEKDGYLYQYSENYAPFPVSNRDSYARFKYIPTDSGMRVEFEAVPDYGPEKPGKVRITKADGFWQLDKINEKSTKVTYQVLADPGGAIPAWLANAAAVDTPFESLLGLRDYLEK